MDRVVKTVQDSMSMLNKPQKTDMATDYWSAGSGMLRVPAPVWTLNRESSFCRCSAKESGQTKREARRASGSGTRI